MKTTLSPQRWLAWTSLCFIVFFMAWYDTVHAHMYTYRLNEWLLENLYVAPVTQITPLLSQIYREALEAFTVLGSAIIFAFAVAVIFIDLLFQKQFKPMLYCLLVIFIISSLTFLCKELISSQRPMFPLELDSFPSGHVARASVWCGLIIMLGQMRVFQVSKYWCYIWLTMPLLVAYTRVGLGYHWISDVIASLALSLGTFMLVYFLIEWINVKKR